MGVSEQERLSYGLLSHGDLSDQSPEPRDPRASDPAIRFIRSDQYLDETEMSGIPQPPVKKDWYSFVDFAIACIVLLLCTAGVYVNTGVYDTIPLGQGMERISLHVTGCDVIFRAVGPGEEPGLHYRSWGFMGGATVKAADGSLDLELRNAHRVPLFRCNAVFRVRPGEELAGELSVRQSGGFAALVTEAPAGAREEDQALVTVGRSMRFELNHAQCQMSGLEAPKVEILIAHGLLELEDPRVADLSIASLSAPVFLSSAHRPVELQMPKATANRTALYGAELDVQAGAAGLDAKLAPATGAGEAVVANISAETVPVTVMCGSPEDAGLKAHLGEQQKSPQFVGSDGAFQSLADFVADSKGLPFIVNVRVIGQGVPHGVWQVLSTNAYLAFSVDWLVLFSAGALKPRVFHAEVYAAGLGVSADASAVFELLRSRLEHVVETFPVAWVPSGGEPVLVFERQGHTFHPRHVTVADIASFMLSLALNLTGALAITAYLGYFVINVLYPYVTAKQCEGTVAKCASHRLGFVNSFGAWQVSACRVNHDPTIDMRQPGVLLRWKMRSNCGSFKRYSIRCHAVQHRFTMPVSKQQVMPSANNPSQLELFIPLHRTASGRDAGRLESLQVGEHYKFQVVGIGQHGSEVQTSAWSSMVYISPPVAFTDLPLMLLNVFAGRSDAQAASLDTFCHSSIANKNTCTRILLHGIYLDLHHSIYNGIMEMVEDGLDVYLMAEWEGGGEVDSKFIDFRDKRHHPPFTPHKSDQFYMNDEPLELAVTRSSEEQEVLIVRLGTRQGDVSIQLVLKFAELHEQWEKQHDYYTSEQAEEVTIFNVPQCCTGSEDKGVGPGMPWWSEVPEEHRKSCLLKTPAGCKMKCWVAFGHDDPYKPDSDNVRWLQYPQSPYPKPNGESAGKPIPISMAWPRATIRGIYPNEVVLQGTRKVLYFSEELELNGQPVFEVSLELRPSFKSEVKKFQRIVSQEPVQVSQGSFIWDVKFVDDGEHDMNDRFVLVATVGGQEYLAASVEFFIVRPVLLSEFEIGYAAYCRSYELPMESLDDVRLAELGIRVATMPLSICEGLRAVLPAERYSQQRKSLRFCTFEGSMVASARPIILEEEAQIYRCALRMVKVLEGTHWRNMHEHLKYDLLLAFNFDHSWALAKKLKAEKLRFLFKHVLTVMLYILQIVTFLFPPMMAFLLTVVHQYMHNSLCYHYYYTDPLKKYITDWLYSPGHLESISDQSPGVQIMLLLILAYSCVVMATLIYMNFFRSRIYKLDTLLNTIASALIGSVSFVTVMILCIALLWVGLAALINPPDVLPFAVMIGSLLYTSKRLIYSLTKVQVRVKDQVDFMVEKVLSIMLDDFIQGQVDLANFSMQTLKIDELDPAKAKFVRCLCELGEEVPRAPAVMPLEDSPVSARGSLSARGGRASIRNSQADAGGEIVDPLAAEEEEDDEDEAEAEQADAGAGRQGGSGFSPQLRRKLQMCFHYIVAKLPLPPGIQQSLRDPQQLARNCVDRRNTMLQRLIGSDGEGILRDLVERNLDTKLMDALVTVLQKGEESDIDIMDHDSLTREAVLFYDKELAEQILSMVHCRLDLYLEQLKTKTRVVFASLHSTNVDLNDRRRVEQELNEYVQTYQGLVDKHELPEELCPYEVDTSGDGVANCSLLPFLQLLGVLPPFNLVEDDPFTRKDIFERLLNFAASRAKKVTSGQTVLHKYHVTAVLLQLCDQVGDGRVDHLWWAGFLQVCKDIYILAGRDLKDTREYPVQLDDVASAWNAEVADTDMPLVNVERIEDVILAKLMTRKGSKKLWREGLVQLARHLHLWPEIPFDDTVVEVARGAGGSSCEVLNIVSTITKPERHLHGELKGIVEDVKQDPPKPPEVGKTPVYKDEPDLVFADMGDFSPESGFAMLWHKRSDLCKSSSQPWVAVTWDADALMYEAEPPYPGPLDIYLVFMNLHPEQKHSERPWLLEEGWQQVDGKKLPTVERKVDVADSETEMFQHVMHARGGFPPSRLRRLPGGIKPKAEVFRKTFGSHGAECRAELRGMGCESHGGDVPIDPVFVFFQAQRLQMPDSQSFEDAHFSPFCRSKLFEDIWNFYDKSEALRSPAVSDGVISFRTSTTDPSLAEDISGKTLTLLKTTPATGCIDLTPDSPELLRFLFLRRYMLKKRPDVCKKNASLQVVEPEQLRLGLSREDRHTGKRKPFYLQPLQQDFFCEDIAFVELDTAEYKEYKFEATATRDGSTGDVPTQVAVLGLLYKGKLVGKKENMEGSTGPITISFAKKTIIDQLNFRTLARPSDPTQWRVSGRNASSEEWAELFDRATEYPLDPRAELVEVGKRQEGAIWHREGNTWLRLRGLWFDAFHELLGALDLKVDRAAAWSLWRLMLSIKHKPVVTQRHPGFVTVAQVREALSVLMKEEAFLSDDLFGWWNVESRLGLEESFKRKLYASICSLTPDYHGAANLVRWKDLSRILQARILRSKPYLEKRSATGRAASSSRQYIVGSLWFEVLYQIVISSMPERYSREEVRQHFDAYANPRTGMLALDRTYDVIAKLGRPGLKFVDFSRFVSTLGMQIDRASLRLAFNRVDIDQSFTLDAEDMQCGITLLLRQVLPKQVLQMAGISTEQIVLHVAFWLTVLCIIFFFLILSFFSLLNGRGNAVVSTLQSAVAAFAGLGVSAEGSKNVKQEDVDELVARSMEKTLGSSGRLAAQQSSTGGTRQSL